MRRYGEEGPGAVGTVEHAVLRIGDREVRLFDSPVKHGFGFTPAVSLFVDLDTAAEADAAFEKLSAGGAVLMPLDACPRGGRARGRSAEVAEVGGPDAGALFSFERPGRGADADLRVVAEYVRSVGGSAIVTTRSVTLRRNGGTLR